MAFANARSLLRFLRCSIGHTVRNRAGTTAVEWAFLALAFVTMLIASLEVGRYFFAAQSLRNLVGEVTRASIVDAGVGTVTGGGNDCSVAKDRFAPRTPLINTPALNLCVARSRATGIVTVQVEGSFEFLFANPVLQGRIFTLRESARFSFPG